MISVVDCSGRTHIGTAETADAVFKDCHRSLAGLFVKGETTGRTNIQAEVTTATGPLINCHFQHRSSSVSRG